MRTAAHVHLLRDACPRRHHRGRIDAFVNWRLPQPATTALAPGRTNSPALWLVGDEGVYMMSNGKLAEGAASARRLCRGMRSGNQSRLIGTTSAGISAAMTTADRLPRCRECSSKPIAAAPAATHLSIATTDDSTVDHTVSAADLSGHAFSATIATIRSRRLAQRADGARPASQENFTMAHDDPFTIDLFGKAPPSRPASASA